MAKMHARRRGKSASAKPLVTENPEWVTMSKEEIEQITGVEAGFIGPVGLEIRIVADPSVQSGCYVVGANKPQAHLRGVVPGRDFQAESAATEKTMGTLPVFITGR